MEFYRMRYRPDHELSEGSGITLVCRQSSLRWGDFALVWVPGPNPESGAAPDPMTFGENGEAFICTHPTHNRFRPLHSNITILMIRRGPTVAKGQVRRTYIALRSYSAHKKASDSSREADTR